MASKRKGGVEVKGLSQLRRALKELGPDFQKELRQAGKDTSIKVAGDARSGALGLGGVAAKSAPAVKNTTLRSNLLGAGVVLDGEKYPMALGAEFGGQRRPTTKQFEPWRGSGSGAGYFVYPAIRNNAAFIEEQYVDAIDGALRQNGFI
jgi:hypothetical protein